MFFQSSGPSRPRVVVGILIGVLAFLLGFVIFTPSQALMLVRGGGYWFVVVAFALFCAAIARILAAWWRERRFCWADAGCAAFVLACGLLLQCHEPHRLKVLMDEVMLLGASMSLHLNKTAMVPARGADLQGTFQLLGGFLDKRPLFFPVVLSLVHDVTGYRPTNGIWLNAGLVFVFLGLLFAVGHRFAGRCGGILAVLLMTSLPLLAQNATGGGFELLNITMQLAFLLLAIRTLERRDDLSLSAFCLAAVLLAQTRYESVLFILPALLVIGWLWWREQRVRLTGAMLVCPLLLVPYPLQHRVFDLRTESWELASQPGYHEVFSPWYLCDNVGHAMAFFFDFSRTAPNSPLLAALGLVALVGLTFLFARRLVGLTAAPAEHVALVFVSLGYALVTLVFLFYFWGKFDDPVIRRLSLPLHVFMVIATVVVFAYWRLPRWGWNAAIGAVLAFILGWTIPVMARHAYTQEFAIGREVAWVDDFVAQHPTRDYFVIDNATTTWVAHEVASAPYRVAMARKPALAFLLRNHAFSTIYVVQHLVIDEATHQAAFDPAERLDGDFVLEPVEQRTFGYLSIARLSRLVAIKGLPLHNPAQPAARDLATLTPEQREKLRQRYFDHFLEELP